MNYSLLAFRILFAGTPLVSCCYLLDLSDDLQVTVAVQRMDLFDMVHKDFGYIAEQVVLP